ncbi:MAG: NAD(P)-binding domain-containing protein [Ktedonobacteraceae bacterium]|nr:NAD(P)-binding domain-containing protein [Ktedonobacteraceae bacterium]
MDIAMIGVGHIGANLAQQLTRAGHQVTLAFSRDERRLHELAEQLGPRAQVASPAVAVSQAEVMVLAVPWGQIDLALSQMEEVRGKIVLDATNPFSQGLVDLGGMSSLAYNQRRLPGASVAKVFNTLTAGFQAEVAAGAHRPIAMFYSASDALAHRVCHELIAAMGFVPVALDGPAETLMEAPRRAGAVYGEGYHPSDAETIAQTAKQDLVQAARLADTLKQ